MSNNYKKKEYDRKFQKEKLIRFALNLNKTYDSDIIEYLNTFPNKSKFVKELIRTQINIDKLNQERSNKS